MFFKYMKRYLLLFTLPFMLTYIAIYFAYVNFTKTELIERIKSDFINLSSTTDNIINNTLNQYYQYTTDTDVQYLLSLDQKNLYSYKNNISLNSVLSLLRNSKLSVNYYDEISLYSIKGNYVLSSGYSNTIDNFYDTAWYKKFTTQNAKNFIVSDFDSATHKNAIYVCFPVCNQINETIGLLTITLDYQELNNLLSPEMNKRSIKITDKDGKFIYSSNAKELGAYAHRYTNNLSEDIKIDYTGLRAIISRPTVYNDFTLICDNDISGYSVTLRNTTLLLLLLSLITVIIPIIVSVYMSRNFYKSISNITSQLLFNDSEWAQNESDYVINSINSIIFNKKNIEQELAKNIVQLKKSQIVALQTQLNPHFIYNTLNAVGLSMNNPRVRTDILIKNFSEILEYSLNTKEIFADIKDEIRYTVRYLEIEEIKYMENFNIVFNIDDNVNELATLKFILQPIVENTLRHGFKHRSCDNFQAEISAKMHSDCIEFIIHDTGYGIEPERLSEIQQNLENELFPEAHNIGIYNIHLRIRLIFGKEYGVGITSEKNKGTTVKIRIPIIHKEQIV
ncbi:MAG: histidine kinase [Clostridia bacterium]|nr:histidine kinase [Clostridia bacterium]